MSNQIEDIEIYAYELEDFIKKLTEVHEKVGNVFIGISNQGVSTGVTVKGRKVISGNQLNDYLLFYKG